MNRGNCDIPVVNLACTFNATFTCRGGDDPQIRTCLQFKPKGSFVQLCKASLSDSAKQGTTPCSLMLLRRTDGNCEMRHAALSIDILKAVRALVLAPRQADAKWLTDIIRRVSWWTRLTRDWRQKPVLPSAQQAFHGYLAVVTASSGVKRAQTGAPVW